MLFIVHGLVFLNQLVISVGTWSSVGRYHTWVVSSVVIDIELINWVLNYTLRYCIHT